MEHILEAIVLLYGIIVGSFLNVCIYRIPNKENIISKRSHCMSCGNVLKWYELIPLFSFLIQGGKCRHCHTKLSWQYPFIELANGLLWLWIYLIHGLSIESVLFCLCASALIIIAAIDLRTFEIPVGCNIFIGILGVIRAAFHLWDWQNYVIGFFAVSGLFYIIYLITKATAESVAAILN